MRNLEFVRFFTQRATGALLSLLLAIHLVTIIYATRGGITVAEISQRLQQNWLWQYMYLVFIAVAVTHAAIGLRNICVETLPARKFLVSVFVTLYTVISVWLGFLALRAIWIVS